MVEKSLVSPSAPPPPPPDPMLQAEQEQAQANLVKGMQTQTQGDMASLMARYGSQLAMAGTVAGAYGTPMQPPPGKS